MRKMFVCSEAGVSAIIGVILMVAITVAIAATVYVYVGGMIDGGPMLTPSVSLKGDRLNGHCIVTVSSVSDKDVFWDDVDVLFYNMSDLGVLVDGGLNIPSSVTRVSGGDVISISSVSGGFDYRLSLVYVPSGNLMGVYDWRQ